MAGTETSIYEKYLRNGGELGALTRAFDWSKTDLGPAENWPPQLLTIVGLILQSRFPMLLWWGSELYQFYNDAYRQSLGVSGKHPTALGQKAIDCWIETWPVIHPLIERVMSGGEAHWAEDQLIPIYRNGELDEVYWTFSYSKVEGPEGHPGGVLVVCSETTEKVKSSNSIQNFINILSASEQRFRYILDDAPVAIAIFSGEEMIVEAANKRVLEAWGKTDKIIGLPLEKGVPELQGQPLLGLVDQVYRTGEPYFGNEVKVFIERNSQLEEVYANFVYHPIKDDLGNTFSVMLVANVITEQVLARHALEQAQDMLQLAIESGEVGTWMADWSNNTLELSPRAAKLYGLPEGDRMTPEQAFDLILPEHKDRVRESFENAIKQRTLFSEEYILKPMNGGAVRWVRSNGKAYYNENGETLYVTGAVLDITEHKEDQQRMNDFLAMASHELKTPLSSLMGLIQLLLYGDPGKLPADFRKIALEKSNVQLKKMTALINGFLNISQLEAGKIKLKKEYFDVAELIRSAIEEISLTKAVDQLSFTCNTPVIVEADKDKIESVLFNLIGNALKYSPTDKAIDLDCNVGESLLTISIADKGIGISKKDQAKVFGRYYRSDDEKALRVSGIGIGLYLCREIIEQHGGTIWVESAKEVGSTFYFTLPLGAGSSSL